MVTTVEEAQADAEEGGALAEEMGALAEEIGEREIPVVRAAMPRYWRGEKMYMATGFMRISDFNTRVIIPVRTSQESDGYQRSPASKRCMELSMKLRKSPLTRGDTSADGVDLPNSILLNMRDDNSFVFRPLGPDERGLMPRVGMLEFSRATLYVCDGGHRITALKDTYKSEPERFKNYIVPVSIGLGWPIDYELEQFYSINNNAKPPAIDLAYDLLRKMAEGNPAKMASIENEGKAWMVRAGALASALCRSPLWHGKIRFPNEEAAGTTIPSGGMITNLKPIVSYSFLNQMEQGGNKDFSYQILTAYWEGIKRCIPGAFNEPIKYLVQKSLGVSVFHALFTEIVELIRAKGASLKDPRSYAEILKEPLRALRDENSSGNDVEGADFWRRTQDGGVAGMYSSSAGKSALIGRIKRALPLPAGNGDSSGH